MSDNFEGEFRSLLGLLIRHAMHISLMEQCAVILQHLTPAQLAELSDSWRDWRASFNWDLGDRIRAEVGMLKDQLISIPADEPEARLALLKSAGFSSHSLSALDWGDDQDAVHFLKSFESYANEAARVGDIRDSKKFEAALQEFSSKWDGSDLSPMCEWISEAGLRRNHLKLKRVEVRLAMFELALNIFQDGFDKAATVTDPFDQSEFEVVRGNGDFTLQSTMPYLDGSLSLRFPVEAK